MTNSKNNARFIAFDVNLTFPIRSYHSVPEIWFVSPRSSDAPF